MINRPRFAATRVAAAAVIALMLPAAAKAAGSVFGSLANFDVVNDTGNNAYGFEIEIEDILYDHPGTISSIFGYDRDFGYPGGPGAVVRFGKPVVEYLSGIGARITYGGSYGGAFTQFNDPAAPYVTHGESCWPGASATWTANPCDHFGVSTYGSPAKTTYSWIVDVGGGALAKQVVGVPAVNIVYAPPPGQPQLPAVPQMQLLAQDLNLAPADPVVNNQKNAFWVKIVKTELDDNVVLGDLLGGNHDGARPEIAGLDDAEVEFEWQPLQIGMVDEVTKSVDSPKPSVVYKFQFFNYVGRYDDDGYVDPQSGNNPEKPDQTEDQRPFIDGAGIPYVTIDGQRHDLVFVGQQIAGFNANEVPAVPEPQTYAMMLAGLAGIGWLTARRRRG